LKYQDPRTDPFSVWVANAWSNNFVYDGKMRRRIERDYGWTGSAWAETNEVHFIYDGNVVVQERDANNLSRVTYTRGNDLSGSLQGAGGIGGLLARSDNTQMTIGSSSAHAYYHADGNGNVTMLVNNLQLVSAKYLYDPFGNTLSLSGPLASANTYRFSSKEWNPNSGLYYYLYRFYDPNLQRWLNRDPIYEKGGINMYEFVRNQAITHRDAYGLILSACDAAKLALKNAADNVANNPDSQDAIDAWWQAKNAMDAACNNQPPPPTFPPTSCPDAPGLFNPGRTPPQNNQSFCSNHPWICGGAVLTGVGIGVTVTCILQPELCIGAVEIGGTIVRGAAPIIAGGATATAL
jgi:RHS repeat-associated protein